RHQDRCGPAARVRRRAGRRDAAPAPARAAARRRRRRLRRARHRRRDVPAVDARGRGHRTLPRTRPPERPAAVPARPEGREPAGARARGRRARRAGAVGALLAHRARRVTPDLEAHWSRSWRERRLLRESSVLPLPLPLPLVFAGGGVGVGVGVGLLAAVFAATRVLGVVVPVFEVDAAFVFAFAAVFVFAAVLPFAVDAAGGVGVRWNIAHARSQSAKRATNRSSDSLGLAPITARRRAISS